ncbi:VPLPA-CTERM sorting domain-containing protein [Paracoccus sp. S3-43]|uniref:VPLPA-CTERM sorting domain-containing protein n=1 Tax=Paracoccus sp. S3-43 TaxID=3030011 RepID=UPI0023AFCA21|nr:VPLPA-CTERM sorting domain-containing protein [Paracoccus sp. S3-43]WEF23980.1 VPLPA-CTERM sorting domain-containing protein [Paracoccus sp. S3-43]
MNIATFATATAVAALMATGASAATLSLVAPTETQFNLSGFNPTGSPVDLNGQDIEFISGDKKTASNGLSVSGPARVTFTYLGYEAGHQNSSYGFGIDGNFLFENATATVGSSYTYTQAGADLVNFTFHTANPLSYFHNHDVADPATGDYAIGYLRISDTSWYALFDDIAQNDRDFDDLVLRIDVAPVPLPAAGFLLLGGMGALGAAARRRKAA